MYQYQGQSNVVKKPKKDEVVMAQPLNLQQLATLIDTLKAIAANGSENINVRIKAGEIVALFDPPSLSAIQNAFVGGTTNEKLAALGLLEGAILGGRVV